MVTWRCDRPVSRPVRQIVHSVATRTFPLFGTYILELFYTSGRSYIRQAGSPFCTLTARSRLRVTALHVGRNVYVIYFDRSHYLCKRIKRTISISYFIVTICQQKKPNVLINPLNTKRRLLYLKTQFVPRSKHFSSRL